ncbi:MAG: transposase, partial [Candidatus Nitrosopolaris sp.]
KWNSSTIRRLLLYKCVAVCESTSNLWLKTYQAFEKYSIGVKLANPLKTKAIAEAKIKTDTLDARTLAHLLRSDTPPFFIRRS